MPRFPPEYYAVCQTNSAPRKNQWFCNRPLPPISTSEESRATASDLAEFNNKNVMDSAPSAVPLHNTVNDVNSSQETNSGTFTELHVLQEENNKIYAVCQANSTPREEPWFCIRPLSPITTSEEFRATVCDLPEFNHNKLMDLTSLDNTINTISSSHETNLGTSTELHVMQEENDEMDVTTFSPADNSLADPDYTISGSDGNSEENEDVTTFSPADNSLADPDYTISGSDGNSKENESDERSESENIEKSESQENLEENNKRNLAEDELGTKKANGDVRKGKKKKDFCFFCECYVLNFARHIQRNHESEIEVQKISSLPSGSSERKDLLCVLRKKGNFLMSSNVMKPVKSGNTDVLPCSNCRGFYSCKQLWRHKKACVGVKGAHQADGQNFLLKHLNHEVDKQLVETVFPRMRPDEISLTAKKDILICAYGTRYLKTHREKHFINVTSRKMRELARLLIELKKQDSNIKCLFDALKPQHFDLLVAATKNVGQYDKKEEHYKSASTALNMGTNLKQCCEIAIVFALKRKSVYGTIQAASAEADLKTLIKIIESHWRFEISSQAANDLSVKKWNKLTLVPLASDLKKLRDFLIAKANSAITTLENNNNKSAYLTLLETIYCRLLLLNRRRPGELQRLPLYLYQNNFSQSQNYEEFSDIVSPSEKILLQRFKRVVIRGKRGRGVPVLFSEDVQDHIKILLEHRNKYMTKNNTYLFGHPDTSYPIYGYKTIKKYAISCGASNPDAITATKLRKHLATLTQVLNMTDNDIEQLSTFMGHTVTVHRGSYRLPDDVFQTAKMAKLLLLMEKGGASEYKGKSLDQIDIDLEIDIDDNDDEKEPLSQVMASTSSNVVEKNCVNPQQSTSSGVESASKPNVAAKSKRILVPWTEEQKSTLCKYFSGHIKKKKAPKKKECDALKEKYPGLFDNKGWLKIKVCVQNFYSKK